MYTSVGDPEDPRPMEREFDRVLMRYVTVLQDRRLRVLAHFCV